MQEALLGVYEATETYNPEISKFSTYAGIHIKKRLNILLINNVWNTIHIPRYITEKKQEAERIKNEFKRKTGKFPTLEELTEEINLNQAVKSLKERGIESTEQNIEDYYGGIHTKIKPHKYTREQIKTLDLSISPLQNTYKESEEIYTLKPKIDKKTKTPEENAIHKETLEQIKTAVERGVLDERELTIINLRFGLDKKEQLTLREIGERLGYTKERIRQIETRALEKLRFCLNNKKAA